MDECIKIFRERNAPSIAAQPGFHHGHWWVDRASGVATVTFWENATGERASRTNIPGLVERMADVLATHDVYQETFESVHDQYLPRKARVVHRAPVRLAAPNFTLERSAGSPSLAAAAHARFPDSGRSGRLGLSSYTRCPEVVSC